MGTSGGKHVTNMSGETLSLPLAPMAYRAVRDRSFFYEGDWGGGGGGGLVRFGKHHLKITGPPLAY